MAPITSDSTPASADAPRCILCGFNRCHFCETGTAVELSTFDSPVGAFRVPACGQCCENPRKLSCPEAVRLVLDHPADDDPDDSDAAEVAEPAPVAASALYEDRRFTFGLVYEVAKVIERHGYEGVLSGAAMVELQGHLFAFLHGTDEGRDGCCYGKALTQALQRHLDQQGGAAASLDDGGAR